MIVRAMGDRALLIECDDVLGTYAAILAADIPGLVDIVPAARSVLVRFDRVPESTLVDGLAPLVIDERAPRLIEIEVVYDGPDLADVAALSGMSPEEVVAVHSAGNYDVAFCGFAPGFAYLTGVDPALVVPRRDTPRTRVPAGSVALAAGYTGIYPRSSPGGWQLIGRTNAELFNPHRQPPALLTPGDRVRFKSVPSLPERDEPDAGPLDHDGVLDDITTGALAIVQDLGRPGHGAIAVGASGAFDRAALRLANRLVGNPEGAAAVECVGGGLSVRARSTCTVTLTGAQGPASVDGHPIDRGAPIHLPPGAELSVGPPVRGLRTYLAIRGGIAAPETLGSRSTDTLAGLGPRPLAAGDVLAVGVPGGEPLVDFVPSSALSDSIDLRVVRGPRWDWFTDSAHAALTDAPYVVSARSDRVGLRLEGPSLDRVTPGRELEPEGMVRGAIQVPPDGAPVLLGPDHPVTGGYPVIAVVVDADLDICAHMTPGTPLRFGVVG